MTQNRAAPRVSTLLAGYLLAMFVGVSPLTALAALPADHPDVPEASPLPAAVPRDTSLVDSSLPPGTILVDVRDQSDGPLPGALVTLKTRPHVSGAGLRPERRVRADSDSVARFDNLDTGDAVSYQVTVSSPLAGSTDAAYSSDAFDLDARHGQRLRVHVFPTTTRMEDAVVGMQGVVYLELEDDAVGVNEFFQIFNLGAVTWMPTNVVVELPDGYSAFQSGAATARLGFDELRGQGAQLHGAITPGQHDASFRFRLPLPSNGSLTFSVSLPPHVGRLRVVSDLAPGMKLEVPGFPAAEIDVDRSDRRILATERELTRGDAPLTRVTVSLSDIPSSTRFAPWFLAIALAVMAAGVVLALSARRSGLEQNDLTDARSRLVDEIAALDRARELGVIGAEGHERLRQVMLEALGRVLTRIAR